MYPLKVRAFDLAAGARRQLTVPIDRKRTVLARRGLARGAKVSLRVVLVVTDAAGNSAVTRRVVPLR